MRLCGPLLLGWAIVLAGCVSRGEHQVPMMCDPAVLERCIAVREDVVDRERVSRPGTIVPLLHPGPAAVRGPRGLQPLEERPVRGPRLRMFTGDYFSVGYLAGWRVETAETRKRSYLDTTIRSTRSPWTYLRVDVTPRLGEADPARHARRAEAYLRGQPGYRRLDFRRTLLGGTQVLRWEFTVRESCVLLREVDLFFTDAQGNGFAILTQAPAMHYHQHVELFDRMRSTLVPRAGSDSPFFD